MGQQSIGQWPERSELDPRGLVTVDVVHRAGICGPRVCRHEKTGRAQPSRRESQGEQRDDAHPLNPVNRASNPGGTMTKKWFSVAEVAEMLGFGETKVRMAIIHGDLRSVKDGRQRRILPQWVDEYVALKVTQSGQDVA